MIAKTTHSWNVNHAVNKSYPLCSSHVSSKTMLSIDPREDISGSFRLRCSCEQSLKALATHQSENLMCLALSLW